MTEILPNELTSKQFSDALQKGQGRAYLHITPDNHEKYRADILNACLHNLAYDPQCEGARTTWLYEILERTGKSETYKPKLIEALGTVDDFWDLLQLFQLVAKFAVNDESAHESLYKKFAQILPHNNYDWFAEVIIKQDGQEGLEYVAKTVGKCLLEQPDFQPYGGFWLEIEDYIDREAAETRLRECAKTQIDIEAFLSYFDNYVQHMRHNKRPFKGKSLTEILTNIENGYRKFLGVYSIWGQKHASKSDLDIIFSALLNEERPEQLLCYLWVFRLQAVPILHDKLFEWAQDADFEIQSAAINVLANIKDYQVRQFGIDLLQKRPESIHQDALRLFWNNYELGDEQLFEEIVSIPNDMDLKHGVCFDLLEIGSKWQQHKLANLMAWVYENTPCSRCRRKSIKLLLEWEQASIPLLEEACWDCDDEIRERAKQALAKLEYDNEANY